MSASAPFFAKRGAPHRELHSFPTRRSSDLHAEPLLRARQRAVGLPGVVEPQAPHHQAGAEADALAIGEEPDRKSTRLNSSHLGTSYAVFCLKKKSRQVVFQPPS